MSLVGGLVFGVLSAIGAFQVSKNPKNIWVSFGKFWQLDQEGRGKKSDVIYLLPQVSRILESDWSDCVFLAVKSKTFKRMLLFL